MRKRVKPELTLETPFLYQLGKSLPKIYQIIPQIICILVPEQR